VPLFKKFEIADEQALKDCFFKEQEQHYQEWQTILNSTRIKQIEWADERSTGSRKASFVQPWKGYLQEVGRIPPFRQIMTEHTVEEYGKKLATAMNWLHELLDIEIDQLTCICALYDLCTQQGSLNKAHRQIREQIEAKPPDDQVEYVRIVVEERGKTANSKWRADCVSRRLGILNRQRTPVTIDANKANRENRSFYLLRNVQISNSEALRT